MIRHLLATAGRAALLAETFGAGDLARAAGLLHDAGKLRAAFQGYIRGEGPAAEHSICGAILAAKQHYPGPLGRLLAYAIAGHHGGLPDGGAAAPADLDARLAEGRRLLADMAPWPQELALPGKPAFPLRCDRRDMAFAASFLTRMLFSALVDADFLETERFYTPAQAAERDAVATIPIAALRQRLDRHLAGLPATSDAAPAVNARRADVLRHCRETAESDPGVFSLSVPTGGGKTLSSLAFALRHAERNGLGRVIYVIPFTSIIEQTADVFRRAFGDLADAVVEHHSAAPVVETEDTMGPKRLAAENWDAPVIVTTSVQFFETLYANQPSRCRKLHNIAGAVVVLDEVQALPLSLLAPCVRALRELAERCRTTVVLCSATLPDLGRSPNLGTGFASVTGIIDDVAGLFAAFGRVKSERAGRLDDDQLALRLAAEPQVLCVVDSRAQAAELFALVAKHHPEGTVHLSASLCPAHRREVLDEVRRRLTDGLPCRLVATTVVEAGVDVDFPVVWRAAAGIDSLAQAAGRCNRHGLLPFGRFVIFDSPRKLWLSELSRRRELAAPLVQAADDPLSLETVRRYFATLLAVDKGCLDGPGILRRLDEGGATMTWPFRGIARDFRMIDQDTTAVIVPWRGVTEPLVAELRAGTVTLKTLRALQQVSVAVYPGPMRALEAAGAIERLGPDRRFSLLVRGEFYDAGVGLRTGVDGDY
ncbi:MAG: CRISPR-associated endonuclease Cas3'' [Magnetospirillum sp.]|nr:CRISPR-associated endonuclease Cas3'' [Magnetospirillum sp.]